VITAVTDGATYLAGLVRLAVSLHAHSPKLPLHVWSTNASAAAAALGPAMTADVTVDQYHDRTTDTDFLGLLGRVAREEDRAQIRDKFHYKLMKVHSAARSPFVRTLFVDADAQICTDVLPLLAALNRTADGEFHLAATGTFHHKEAFNHAIAPSGQAADSILPIEIAANGLDRGINSGVLLYNTNSLAQQLVMSKWEGAFLKRVAEAIDSGNWTMDNKDRSHSTTLIYKDQPSLLALINASVLKHGLRFGFLDGRWNQRHSACIPNAINATNATNATNAAGYASTQRSRDKMDICTPGPPDAASSSKCTLVHPFILHGGWQGVSKLIKAQKELIKVQKRRSHQQEVGVKELRNRTRSASTPMAMQTTGSSKTAHLLPTSRF